VVKRFGGIAVGVVVAIVVLALKLGGGFGIGFLSAKASAPDVGDCVNVTGTASSPDIKKTDCDDAFYKVVSDDGDCDPNEDEFTEEVTGAKAVDLCLFVNAEPGDCLRENPATPSGGEHVDCAGNEGQPGVVRVVSLGSSDEAQCKKQQSIVDETRNLTLCFAPN